MHGDVGPTGPPVIAGGIDGVVVTHPDGDHLPGVATFLGRFADGHEFRVTLGACHGERPEQLKPLVPAGRRPLGLAVLLLPAADRETRLEEWLDHVACAREAGDDPRLVVWSILLLAVPRTVVRARTRRLRRSRSTVL